MISTEILLLGLVVFCSADLYMQNPRGCNNRHSEANTNRNNANRLFDSQNNGKGGYCWGPPMQFYEGSQLSIEWTHQHGCGNPKLACNLVIQFMCGDGRDSEEVRIRDGDGSTTDRIPDEPGAAFQKGTGNDPNTDLKYGMHESYAYYQACKTRNRNKGLFIADRESEGNLNQNRPAARFTRQNNNGNRHGYECPEERDYYPYWHPSPWMDIAYLAEDMDHCGQVRGQSQNTLSKNWCEKDGSPSAPNNEAACLADGGEWKEAPSHGLSPPDCVKAEFTRHNHLGNSKSGYTLSYNWTIPQGSSADQLQCVKTGTCHCILRMRYNISQADIGTHDPNEGFLDWTSNGDSKDAVILDDQIMNDRDGNPHQLAINTAQFGRTFQDRSFVFKILKRDTDMPDIARIHNLNVRGKRGNIVQTYPATEYDFVPNALGVRVHDYIHFQWTGCDNNPNGNAGEGTEQTDRSNIVEISSYGKALIDDSSSMFPSSGTRKSLAYLDQEKECKDDKVGNEDDPNCCPSWERLLQENNNNANEAEQDVRNCMKMNAAPAYWNQGAVKMSRSGNYYYMSTRNNNFTNRGQKGHIYVAPLLPIWAFVMVALGGVIMLSSFGVAGTILYSRAHPHSRIAHYLAKV